MVTVSAMVATLFFGGWDIPFLRWDEGGSGLAAVATGLFMFLKTFFFLFLFMWVRWTLPRFRYDQLMSLGWKFLLPVALCYIMITALAIWGIERAAGITAAVPKLGILFLLNLVLGYIVFFLLDRGHILSGSYRQDETAGGAARARAAA
jgi:NADH-quinone oxidoreductase subunit H